LYGLPIITKSYSQHLEDPVFDDQLNYFKQLVSVERSQSSENNSNRNRWNDQSSESKINIPESLPEPPIHHFINFDDDESYSRRSDAKSRYGYNDKSSKHNDTYTINHDQSYESEHGSTDRSFRSCGRYRKSEHNSNASSMKMSNFNEDSFDNQIYNRKHRNYNGHSSSNWRENSNYNQEPSYTDDDNFANVVPVRNLRDTMFKKRKHMDSEYYHDTNANEKGSSSLDLRDTMHHNKNRRYENQGQHESDFNNRWSERNKNKRGNNNFSSNKNNRNQNNYTNQEYNDQSFKQDNFQEYNNEYQNNYNDGYRRDKNKSNNYKYNQMRSQNMESNGRQQSSYSPYKRNNDGYDKKPYTNSYTQRGGRSRGKNFNRGNDRSRQNYY
jgi:hypothetical protein